MVLRGLPTANSTKHLTLMYTVLYCLSDSRYLCALRALVFGICFVLKIRYQSKSRIIFWWRLLNEDAQHIYYYVLCNLALVPNIENMGVAWVLGYSTCAFLQAYMKLSTYKEGLVSWGDWFGGSLWFTIIIYSYLAYVLIRC
jgi:hypothetical protein